MSESVSELGFKIPSTPRSYGDGTSVKVACQRPEKRGIDLAIPGLVVKRVIHYDTATPALM